MGFAFLRESRGTGTPAWTVTAAGAERGKSARRRGLVGQSDEVAAPEASMVTEGVLLLSGGEEIAISASACAVRIRPTTVEAPVSSAVLNEREAWPLALALGLRASTRSLIHVRAPKRRVTSAAAIRKT